MTGVGYAASAAFIAGKKFKRDNTWIVINNDDGTAVFYLWGNDIARQSPEQRERRVFEIRNAGYDTRTTNSRLNDLPGVNVFHKKGDLFLNNQPWSGLWTEVDY
jgi:hypothetical protein